MMSTTERITNETFKEIRSKDPNVKTKFVPLERDKKNGMIPDRFAKLLIKNRGK